MFNIKNDINQQDFKIIDLHFVKSEYCGIYIRKSPFDFLVGEGRDLYQLLFFH